MSLVHFVGTIISENQRIGFIKSGDILSNMDEKWIPSYQRERVDNRNKVLGIMAMYNERPNEAPPVRISFTGKIEADKKEAILDGKFSIIDGQQRLLALRDSGNKNVSVAVQLYINIAVGDEVRMFQAQKHQSKLTFGDYANSLNCPAGAWLRKWLTKNTLPIRVSANPSANSLGLNLVCAIYRYCYRRMIDKTNVKTSVHGKGLISFLENLQDDKTKLSLVEYGLSNILKEYLRIFGEFDPRAAAYKRSFMLACCHLFVDAFITDSGHLNFGIHEKKTNAIPEIFRSSKMREMITNNERESTIYDEIVDFINHGRIKHRLSHLSQPESHSTVVLM